MIFSIFDLQPDPIDDDSVRLAWDIQHIKAKIICIKCLSVILHQNSSNVQKFIDKKGIFKIIHLLSINNDTSNINNNNYNVNINNNDDLMIDFSNYNKLESSETVINQITNNNNLKFMRNAKKNPDFSNIFPFFSIEDFGKIDIKILNWLPQYFSRENIENNNNNNSINENFEKKVIELKYWIWVLKQEAITFIGDLCGISNQIRFQILDMNALSLFFDFWKCHTRTFFEFQKFLSLIGDDDEKKAKKRFFYSKYL